MIQKHSDESVINLRSTVDDEPEFRIARVEEESEETTVVQKMPDMVEEALQSGDKVKIKFDKFVNLVATHAYEDIVELHEDDDIIISTDLLADLANAHEEKSDKKVPMMFLTGIVLGILIAWFLIKY